MGELQNSVIQEVGVHLHIPPEMHILMEAFLYVMWHILFLARLLRQILKLVCAFAFSISTYTIEVFLIVDKHSLLGLVLRVILTCALFNISEALNSTITPRI